MPVAAIFDLDGLLVDSEPLWVQAEIEIFGQVGLRLSARDCARTTGLRIDEVAAFWARERPWQGPPARELARRVTDRMEILLASRVQPLPGAVQAVRLLQEAGVPLALASSSEARLIHAALGRLGLASAFPVLCSAADEARGKPDPAVYLRAARELAIAPADCRAFEDSANGLQAALAAGIPTVVVGPRPLPGARWQLPSLEAFDLALWEALSGSP